MFPETENIPNMAIYDKLKLEAPKLDKTLAEISQQMQPPHPQPNPYAGMSANANTRKAAFELLMSSIGMFDTPAIQPLLMSNPGLVQMKGLNGMSPLHRACLIGDYNTILMLLEANSDVNAVTDCNETPLHYACKRGLLEVVHLLVQHGARADVTDDKGRGPLHHAAETGSGLVFRYFEDIGAPISSTDVDNDGQSPLHIAIKGCQNNLFLYLMKKGRSDLRQVDGNGNLGIHISASQGFGNMTWQMFAVLGVPVLKKRNNEGLTILQLIEKQTGNKRNTKLLKTLQEYERQPDNTPISDPTTMWYFFLLGPFMIYAITVGLASQMTEYQFLPFGVSLIIVYWNLGEINHRLPDIARSPNPLFQGFFYGTTCHCTIHYYWKILPYTYDYFMFLLLFSTLLATLHLVYWKFVLQTPVSVTKSEVDLKTGRPLTVVDIMNTSESNQHHRYCIFCDIVTSDTVKHCKLCERCYYRMDHHCLFLTKCVTADNHPLFCWFLLSSVANMACYVVAFVIYIRAEYSDNTLGNLCWILINQEVWLTSLTCLCAVSGASNMGQLKVQYTLVVRDCTVYFSSELGSKSGYFRLTTRQKLVNFVSFLLYKPLPHRNPNSPFYKERMV